VFEIVELDPKQCKAMDEEIIVLEKKNQTWRICLLPKSKRLIVNEYIKLNIIVMVL
jgi:hypothetical protein